MSARKISPDVLPRISDTLGSIVYKRGVHQRALALLRESASRPPDSPMVVYVARHETARECGPAALSSLAWGAGTAWPRQRGVGSCRRQSRSRATEFYSSAQNTASGISNARSTARITGIETSTV